MIAFGSSFPGSIRAIEVDPAHPVVVQKSGFLASEQGVELSIFFQKKLGAGVFGGEGFIMQKLSGHGTAFVELDGSAVEYELQAGESMVIDSGNLAMMDATCSMDIQMVKGVKNVLFGGEGPVQHGGHRPGQNRAPDHGHQRRGRRPGPIPQHGEQVSQSFLEATGAGTHVCRHLAVMTALAVRDAGGVCRRKSASALCQKPPAASQHIPPRGLKVPGYTRDLPPPDPGDRNTPAGGAACRRDRRRRCGTYCGGWPCPFR